MLMNKIPLPKLQISKLQNVFSFFTIEKLRPRQSPEIPNYYNCSLATFQDMFHTHINLYLDNKLESHKKYSDSAMTFEVVKYATSLIRSGGKRIRPYIAFVAYYNEGGTNVDEAIQAGIALELFHTFALIHDDIIDKGTERHGKMSTHVHLEKYMSSFPRGNKAHIASSMAMLAGDLILSWSHGVIASLDNKKVQNIFLKMIEELVAGQLLDVTFMLQYEVETKTITRKNELKTALYSFVNPMLIGSALAHKFSHDDFYRELGLVVGQAYQIQDDLLDIVGDLNKTGKMNLLDVQDGQHTILSQYIFENAQTQDKEVFMSLFGKDIDSHGRKVLLRLFKDSGAIRFAENEITVLFEKAKKIISESGMKTPTKKVWNSLVDLLDKRKS